MGDHPDEIWNQNTETDDENSRALHVERAKPLESGQRETEAQQRDPERAGAEELPQLVPEIGADRTGDGNGKQRQPGEQAERQRGERPESAACVGRHTGTGVSVTRRSWKCGSTGYASRREASRMSSRRPTLISSRPPRLRLSGRSQRSP